MSVRSLTAVVALILSSGSAITFTNTIALAHTVQRPVKLAQRKPDAGQVSWLRGLNLTPDQIQKIQAIRKQYQERLSEQKQAVRQAQRELKQLMVSNASTEQIRQKFDQLQTLKQRLGDTRIESMLAIRTVLNAEQRQKLSEIIQQQGRRSRDRLEGF